MARESDAGLGGSAARMLSRTSSGRSASTIDVSNWPAWQAPLRNSSLSRRAHGLAARLGNATTSPVSRRIALTAVSSEARCPGSRCALAMASTPNPWRVRLPAISSTIAVTVSGRSDSVPAKPWANAAAVYVSGGRITTLRPRAASRPAPERAIAWAMITSVSNGRCGPCASMAPTGRTAADPGPAASRASSQVIAASGCTVIVSSQLSSSQPRPLSS